MLSSYPTTVCRLHTEITHHVEQRNQENIFSPLLSEASDHSHEVHISGVSIRNVARLLRHAIGPVRKRARSTFCCVFNAGGYGRERFKPSQNHCTINLFPLKDFSALLVAPKKARLASRSSMRISLKGMSVIYQCAITSSVHCPVQC